MNKARNNLNNTWKFPKLVFILFLVFIIPLFLQLIYLTLSPVIYGVNMNKFAANRNTVSTILTAKRGTIYDSEKNLLAVNVSSYTVIAYLNASRTGTSKIPLHVVDKKMTAEKLAPILKMEAIYIEGLLNKDLYQVELGPGGRGIMELTKEAIVALELPGIDFIENAKRYYPNGDFASYIIGYAKQYEKVVANKATYSIIGELGVEGKYNNILNGTDGYLEFQKDRFGYKIPDTKEIRTDPVNGSDIYLTIDSNIQRFLEDAIKESSLTSNAEWGMLIAMDAKTGDILGSASTPSYDPNKLDITNYENPLNSYTFEPGSTMKTYTYMCAIDKGTYVGTQTYMSGQYVIGDNVINDWNRKGWGVITFDKGYEYSSNVGVANIMNTFLTKADLKTCLSKYGFGKITGIELARELPGTIKFNYPIEVASAGFGQGITTTAIQNLQALTIIANDGKMVKPHVISKIINTNNNKVTYERVVELSDQIVKASTTKKIRELMFNTVNGKDASTTGRRYAVAGLNVIGKTGTAQIFNNETGKYSTGPNDFISSFTGMFPGDDPQIIIYAALKRPLVVDNLGTAVKSAIKSIARYLNLDGDTTVVDTVISYPMASYINKNTVDVKAELEALKFDVEIIGNGDKIIKQSPTVDTTILTNDKIILITNDSNLVMPLLKGWSRAEAITFFNLLDLKYELNGYGYVTTQNIPSRTKLKGDEIIKLDLAKKYNLEIVPE